MRSIRSSRLAGAAFAALALSLLVAPSCGGEDGGGSSSNENVGRSCAAADDCYHGIDPMTLQGEIVCIDKVSGGYCSHYCQTDADCCAVDGECETGHPQVCAPFESTGEMYCFLSCEGSDLGGLEPDVYCDKFAYSGFGCRSTGGGSLNRKVCAP